MTYSLWNNLKAGLIDEGENKAVYTKSTRLIAFVLGLLVLAISIFILETRQPFFFTQDDNFAQNLPNILWGCRSLSEGILCTYNPCQLLGIPTASVPQSLLCYPLTYISYYSAVLLGNEYLTVEVFCILHLILGYFSSYWLLRYLRIHPMLSTAGALSYILSGYVLIAGRSWMHMLPVVVFLPLLMACAVRLFRGPLSLKAYILTALVFAAFINVGYPQTWMYAMCFYILACILLVFAKEIPLKRALSGVLALISGIGISFITLYPQTMEAFRFLSNREAEVGNGILVGLLGLFLPYPLSKVPHPNNWGSVNFEYMNQFYYSGSLFMIAFAVFTVILFANIRSRKIISSNIWLICAFIAFLLALGDKGGLWNVLSVLPVFSKFTGPFKFLIYLNLFTAMGSGIVLNRLAAQMKNPGKLIYPISFAVIALMLYSCILPLPSFYSYADEPYPELPVEMKSIMSGIESSTPTRVMSFAPWMNPEKNYVKYLMNDFASVYGIVHLFGYDPLITNTSENKFASEKISDDPAGAFKAYGVKWAIISDIFKSDGQELGPNPAMEPNETAVDGHEIVPDMIRTFEKRIDASDILVLELPDVDSMAFVEDNPQNPLEIKLKGNGADINVAGVSADSTVVVNLLLRPWMKGFADNKEVKLYKDEWGRINSDIPADSSKLMVRYSPPWLTGLFLGLIITALSVAGFSILKKT